MTRKHLRALAAAIGCVALSLVPGVGPAAQADGPYQLIEGTGSTWSQNAVNQWIADVAGNGIPVAYGGGGSSKGRQDFGNRTVDFAITEIPFQGRDPRTGQSDSANGRAFAYMPVVAGGTSFMYHLEIGGQLYRGLRLSGETITKIFTGKITNWSDPAITADNNGFKLPDTKIIPVVRSDGSGTTAQFTAWMDNQYPSLWRPFCQCKGLTSYYPIKDGMVAKDGSVGVASHIAASYGNGTIGYVEYSYALNDNFPVAKVMNKDGYYTLPTAYNVAVALTQARINEDKNSQLYLTQILTGVYNYTDPRTYPLSSYGYLVLPTKVGSSFTTAKGATLAAFSYYAMCQGQTESASLGYSPMPINLVQAAFAQIAKIPGAVQENTDIQKCNNPTFSPTGVNLLAQTAPFPPACDKQGPAQCTTGTGGAVATATPISKGATATSGATSAAANTTTGTSAASGAATAAATGTGAAATATACDPSTGACGATSGGTTSIDPTAATATLAAGTGWTSTQTLLVLIGLVLLALLVIPGLLPRRLERRRSS